MLGILNAVFVESLIILIYGGMFESFIRLQALQILSIFLTSKNIITKATKQLIRQGLFQWGQRSISRYLKVKSQISGNLKFLPAPCVILSYNKGLIVALCTMQQIIELVLQTNYRKIYKSAKFRSEKRLDTYRCYRTSSYHAITRSMTKYIRKPRYLDQYPTQITQGVEVE